ncbi:MAG: hypothetical protein ACRDPY_15235 [Streptosporangiaceae bacterium]
MSELAGVETELGQAAVLVQSLRMAGTITEAVEKILLAVLGNGQPPAEHPDARAQAGAALDQADALAGEALTPHFPATMAFIGIGRALLDVGAAIREQNKLIASGYDDYRGIETVDTGGLT